MPLRAGPGLVLFAARASDEVDFPSSSHSLPPTALGAHPCPPALPPAPTRLRAPAALCVAVLVYPRSLAAPPCCPTFDSAMSWKAFISRNLQSVKIMADPNALSSASARCVCRVRASRRGRRGGVTRAQWRWARGGGCCAGRAQRVDVLMLHLALLHAETATQRCHHSCRPLTPSPSLHSTFWSTHYAEVKALNPRFPFMLRTNGGVEPYMLVEYGAWRGRRAQHWGRRAAARWRAQTLQALSPRSLQPLHARTPCALLPPSLPRPDFARKVQVELAGLTPEGIEAALAEAVAAGDTMPRALHQSVEPLQQATVIE